MSGRDDIPEALKVARGELYRQAEGQQRQLEMIERENQARQARRAQLIAECDLPLTGQTESTSRHLDLPAGTRREGAEAAMWGLGDLHVLPDGRRGLVLDVWLSYVAYDDSEDREDPEQLAEGWWADYQYMPVAEPGE